MSYLFEKYFGYFFVHARYLCSIRILFKYVDTGRSKGDAYFTELDSDFSEPGKHVWTFDMMSVLHVCSSSFLMACLYEHLWMLCACKASYRWASKLMCSYDDKITRSCGDMIGCRLVLLKHASSMSTVNSSFNVGQVSIPFVFPSCCHMCSAKSAVQ